MNILFLVVLAAFWLIGGIVKVRAEQAKRQKNKQSPRDSTAHPSSASKNSGELILEKILGSFIPDSGAKQRSISQQTFKKPTYSQEIRPGITAKSRADKLVLRQKMNQLRKQKLLQKQSLEPKFNELAPIKTDIQTLPEFTTDAVENVEHSYKEFKKGVPISHYLPDFSDSDSLKKAILYYEVLGRPLSLRDPSNPFAGL